MDSKILIVIVVAAIAVVGVAAFFLLGGNGNNDSQYTLLDSDDNISAGMVIEKTGTSGPQNAHSTATVTSVSGGTVTYTEEASQTISDFIDTKMPLSRFLPEDNQLGFDYTDPEDIPAGITVTQDGTKYTITGSNTEFSVTTSYENFVIDYDGSTVSSVSGKQLSSYTYGGESTSSVVEYKTVEKVLFGKMSVTSQSTNTVDVSQFYLKAVSKFDKSQYSGMEIKERNGKYGGVDVVIYNLNGISGGQEYKNVDLYTYHGYMIHAEGTLNQGGEDMKTDVTVTIKKA